MTPRLSGPIVLIINSLMRGGAQRLVIDDANELIGRGFDVRLITLEHERVGDSMMQECHVPISHRICLPFVRGSRVRSLFQMWHLLRVWRPRAVITHLWLSNTIGRLCAFFARVPVCLAFEHNVYEGMKGRSAYRMDACLQWITDRIIAVSGTVKEFLVARGIRSSKIQVVYNGIRLAPFETFTRSRDEVRASLGMSSKEVVFLSVARLVRQKAPDQLLRAFARIRGPHDRLVMVGEGAERASLQVLAGELQLESSVSFLGTRQDIPDLMHAADLFVFPSRWEGLGIVLLEAMAAGLPIISTTVGAIQEIVTSEDNGLLVPPDDVERLAMAMRRLADDQVLRDRFCERGKKRVQLFTITRQVDALLACIEDVERWRRV